MCGQSYDQPPYTDERGDQYHANQDALRAIRDYVRTGTGIDLALDARDHLDRATGDPDVVSAYVKAARAFEAASARAKQERRRFTKDEERDAAYPFANAERELWAALA